MVCGDFLGLQGQWETRGITSDSGTTNSGVSKRGAKADRGWNQPASGSIGTALVPEVLARIKK